MKHKDSKHISIDEDRIKNALKSDIDVAAKQAGDSQEWQRISELAYETNDSVKRSSLAFAFPAVCAVMMAAALGVMQLFSEDFYDLKYSPESPIESRTESAAQEYSEQVCSDGTNSLDSLSVYGDDVEDGEETPIGDISAAYSSDENGYPYTGNYVLSVPVYFPHEEGYTDYGGVYVYVICEGEVLYASDTPTRYETGTNGTVTAWFQMKEITAEQNPQVTVAVCFVRDGGEGNKAAAKTVRLNNPNFSEESADSAFYSEESEFGKAFSLYKGENIAQFTEISDGKDSDDSGSDIAAEYGLEIMLGSEESDALGYDVAVMTTGNAATENGEKAETFYLTDCFGESGYPDEIACKATLAIDKIAAANADYSKGDCIFAVVIPRGGGEIILSEITDIKNLYGEN